MARLLIGAALLPSSVLAVWAAALAVSGLATQSKAAWPFLLGMGGTAALWFLMRYAVEHPDGPLGWASAAARRLYVFGHEMTHALAAWSVGAKVLGMSVRDDGGHVDLSHSNAFIALAPYCVPLYTLLVVAGYRLLLYFKPGAGGRALFLLLVGLTIAFHLIKTFETIWDREQPDLPAAGGVVFSLSLILLANALCVLLLVKALFPAAVDLGGSLREVALRTRGFWRGAYAFIEPLRHSFVAQLKRP
jgi:hypothetical protein